jgi:signal transduction histidine kinase
MPAETSWRARTATVRFRVTAAATIVMLVLLALVSVLVVTVHRRTLTGTLEEGLERTVVDITAALAAGDAEGGLPAFGDDDAFAQVVDVDGRVVAASPNLEGAGPVLPPPSRGRQWRTTGGVPVDDSSFRTLSVEIDDGSIVSAGATLDDIDESVTLLSASLAIAVAVVTVLSAGLVWILVGRTLRPVEAIRREVAAIGGGDLHQRVRVPATGDEVSRLAATMNDMLERVEGAARGQARFVADASHELRSPLTRIRSELEVDLAHPATADPLATHRSVLEEAVGLQQLVDDLLLLARSDAGQPAPRETVDLAEIVHEHARRARGTGRQVDEHIQSVEVSGAPRDLDRALGNVIANAARHARTRLAVTVASDGDDAVVLVDDDGPGIAVTDRGRVFDRFTRLDESRSAGTGGMGLGLSIASDVVTRHGGTITIDDAPLGGARFELHLPIAPARQELGHT